MRVAKLWLVLDNKGKPVERLSDGSKAWARRADAMNAAEVITGEGWRSLYKQGWRLVSTITKVLEA